MSFSRTVCVRSTVVGALIVGTFLAATAFAQSAPAGAAGGMASPADRAIEYRQAVFTLIGGNFGPIGGMMQGRMPFNGADALKRAQRLVSLSEFLSDAFPDISKEGNTKAKPEIWSNRAEFDKLVQDFGNHTAALAAILTKDGNNSEDFKTAATAVGNDCKSCHEKFRAR